MKEITQYLSEDTSVYATALAAAKADYQHAVSVVAHEFYTRGNLRARTPLSMEFLTQWNN